MSQLHPNLRISGDVFHSKKFFGEKMDPRNQYKDSYRTEDEMMGAAGMTRKRTTPSELSGASPGIYEELETLRNLVDEFDGERPGCLKKGTVDGSLMSTVFGIVLVMILSVSAYAFTNLYRAVIRRFYREE